MLLQIARVQSERVELVAAIQKPVAMVDGIMISFLVYWLVAQPG